MRHSAGILVWRDSTRRDFRPTSPQNADRVAPSIQLLLVHPGGPFWANKDEHAWSIPKGEFDPETEDALVCARREFHEEIGQQLPDGALIDLGSFRQNSSKTVHAWCIEADLDVSTIVSNTFEMEWPPRSGTMQSFPEVDRAEWFSIDVAVSKIHKGQRLLLDALREQIGPKT